MLTAVIFSFAPNRDSGKSSVRLGVPMRLKRVWMTDQGDLCLPVLYTPLLNNFTCISRAMPSLMLDHIKSDTRYTNR